MMLVVLFPTVHRNQPASLLFIVRFLILFSGIGRLHGGCHGFVRNHAFGISRKPTRSSSSSLRMVFDFFRQRSLEGLDQMNNLSQAAQRGEWARGFADAAAYTQQTNRAFADALAKSRNRLWQDMETLFTGVSPEQVLEELQDILLQADLGTQTAEEIVAEVKELRQQDTNSFRLSKDDLKSIMRGKLIEALDTGKPREIQFQQPDEPTPFHIPTVLFIMGANGQGKTTTIGKLAHRLRTEGNQTVLLAACDTFRAGAVSQLEQWAQRAEVEIITPNTTVGKVTSPSAVLYNALDYAVTHQIDTVLVDTSGRLSNNDALTQELAKMKRVIQKRLSVENDADGKPILNTRVPHETLLVQDAAQGRMALDAAKAWEESIGLTGLILTKLDGSARGGSVVAVSRDLGLPVKLIGVGEGIEDLRDFEPEIFVDGLLGIGAAGGKMAGSSSNEGAMLAARLEQMRKERDARSKVLKEQPVAVGATPQSPRSLNVPPKPNRPKNKKKKKNK